MGAKNFYFENRCVVLDDEQWDDVLNGYTGIEVGEFRMDGSRSYPSYYIEQSPNRETFIMRPVITSGYYENACIDFVDTSKQVSDVLFGSYSYRYTVDDMIRGIDETWGCIVSSSCSEILNRLKRDFPELDDEDMFWLLDDKATEIIKRHESYVLNGIIDHWKDEMYLTEVYERRRFSNGEMVYQVI